MQPPYPSGPSPYGNPMASSGPTAYASGHGGAVYGAAPGYPGAAAPWQTATQQRSSGSGAGLAVGLVLGAFALLCGGGAAVWYAVTPSCSSDEHRSHGHCCPSGAEWDGARRSCVGGVVAGPTYPQPMPTPTPMPTQPYPPVMTPMPSPTPTPTPYPTPTPTPTPTPRPTFIHACDGVWSGNIIENTGSRGTMDMVVRSSSPVCVRWTESWSSGARCVYVITRCSFTANGVRGVGRSVSPRCTPTVNASVSCASTGAAFREQVGSVIDTAVLGRR